LGAILSKDKLTGISQAQITSLDATQGGDRFAAKINRGVLTNLSQTYTRSRYALEADDIGTDLEIEDCITK
jgi:hypothetical protein